MSAKKKNITDQHHESALFESWEDHVPRVAISEDGHVIYASESFRSLSHIDLGKKKPVEISAVLNFLDDGNGLENIGAGVHKVQINGHEKVFDFHFDWLTAPNQKRYLIGSEALPNTQNITEQEDLQTFADMSHDALVVINKNGKILRANQKFGEIFGTAAADTKVLDFVSLFTTEDQPYIRRTLKTLTLEEGGSIDFEVQTKNDHSHWINWQLHRKGDLFYAIGNDVTAIKVQEQALDKRERQLSEAESIGRMGHWHWTVGENNIEWSEEIYRIFGVSDTGFEPTLDNMNGMVHRQDIARVNQAFQRAIIEEKNYDMEFRITQPGGDVRYIHCEGRCAKDSESEVIALYGIMQDMTERVLYEEQLKEAKDAAERAYAAKTQFLANMSHELRTPLNAIIGFSEMMQRQLLGPIGTEKYLEYVGGIRESGEHLLDLISDILDMSKIEAGKYELDLEEVNVAKTINMAVHMMEGRALDAGVKISTEGVTNETLKIVADRRAIMQIMLNLLSNAVKFTGEGGKVEVECHEREGYLALKVIDNGAGIPANKLAQITKPFEQASSSYARDHEGSGLGLAITKELAEMHGGALSIDSVVDSGTTVTVRLPYDAFKATQV